MINWEVKYNQLEKQRDKLLKVCKELAKERRKYYGLDGAYDEVIIEADQLIAEIEGGI